jgi:FixJ family two-component response regulator
MKAGAFDFIEKPFDAKPRRDRGIARSPNKIATANSITLLA